MPLPPDSPQAIYHSIPQVPEAASSEIALNNEEEDVFSDIPSDLLDPKIKTINFVLGCAVLLPWNGASPSQSSTGPLSDWSLDSNYHCDALFLVTAQGLVAQVNLRVVSHDHIHLGQLHLPRSRHRHLETRSLVSYFRHSCTQTTSRHHRPVGHGQ